MPLSAATGVPAACADHDRPTTDQRLDTGQRRPGQVGPSSSGVHTRSRTKAPALGQLKGLAQELTLTNVRTGQIVTEGTYVPDHRPKGRGH